MMGAGNFHRLTVYLVIGVSLLIAPTRATAQSDLVINELMVLNDTVLPDQFGDYPAWVELYNRGASPVELEGYYFSDNPLHLQKWPIPSGTLNPGETTLLFLSGMDVTDEPPFHTNFTLNNLGARLYLAKNSSQWIDASPKKCVPNNRSIGRLPDGFDDWVYPSQQTPNASNNTAYDSDWSNEMVALDVSHPSGVYTNQLTLQIAAPPDVNVHYTWNTGGTPSDEQLLWSQALLLESRNGEPNGISTIPTTEHVEAFQTPRGPVRKSHVVRAVAYRDGCPASEVFTGNYLVLEEQGNFPYPADVVFVNAERDALFDPEHGIYVYGEDGNYKKRGKLWERPANIEFFNSSGTPYFKQDGGIRIHGGGTREGSQKSIRLYARSEYGPSEFHYPFFEDRELDSYKRLILRMSMGDWSRTLFKDHLAHSLIHDLHVGYQSGEVAVVFLNGEYWGIHSIRERQDKHYLEGHYGVDGDNLDVVEYSLFQAGPVVERGDMMRYNELMDFVWQNSLSDSVNYAAINTMIDVESFIDLHVAQLYFANTDFPENNNTMWRERNNTGVWRWLFYDCDGCMARPQYNQVYENMGEGAFFESRPEWSVALFRALMKSTQFRAQFANRFRTLMNTTFNAGRVIAAINDFEAMYAPLMAEHIMRWGYPNTFDEWLSNVAGLRQFAVQRPVEVMRLLDRYFGKPFAVAPNPNNGNFAIHFDNPSAVSQLSLINMQGRVLHQGDYSGQLHQIIQLNTALAPGAYLLRITISNVTYSEKIIVVRP